ncbi:MAG: hypothetical protein INQ03_22230 [Candidatus Heimdallarchaeota archaeon]|nr:hypothetical protein [Candidatus Heimdallarchaeota archaeon]
MNIAGRLGIDALPAELKSYTYLKLLIDCIRILSGNLFLITITLFYLDTLEPLKVAFIWAAYYGIQAVLDYPTGNLGDMIGHKKILVIAYIFQLGATPFLLFAQSFSSYLIFMSLFAIGASQESGALEAWYDNSYRRLANDIDPERKIFSDYISRISFLYSTMAISGFVSGGFISTYVSREAVFVVFTVLLILIFLIILKFLPFEEPVGSTKYLSQVKNSFMAFLKNRTMFYYFMGIAFIWAANGNIWYPFLLFRLYAEYTGSDAGAGVLRGLIFFSGLLWQILIIKIIRFFKKDYFWVFFCTLISNSIWFCFIMVYYFSWPPAGFNFYQVLGFFALYQIPSFWESLQGVLQSKINLDLVPDEYRNSMYSLLPTIAQGLGLPLVLITGFLIDSYGIRYSFYWVILVSFVGSMLLGVAFLINKNEERTSLGTSN